MLLILATVDFQYAGKRKKIRVSSRTVYYFANAPNILSEGCITTKCPVRCTFLLANGIYF